MATLTITDSRDFRAMTLRNVDSIVFDIPATFPEQSETALFGSNQFGAGLISNTVSITGDDVSNVVEVRLATASSFYAAGWSFSQWNDTPALDSIVISGSSGADTILGSVEGDTITGRDGDDILAGNRGGDNLFGDDGDDDLSSRQKQNASLLFVADQIDETDSGERGAIMSGGLGDDIITISHDFHGTMTVDGGTDTDVLRFAGDVFVLTNPTIPNLVDLEAKSGRTPFGSKLVVSGIEIAHGSDIYRDILRGDNFSNALRGFGNNDRLEGRGGADTLDGGSGRDVADYSSSLGVNVDLTRAQQTGADAQGDVLVSIEEVDGSFFADTLRGDGSGNSLFGNNGSDTLEGRAGGDTLNGGGNFDSASYASSNAAVNVTLNNGVGSSASGGHAAGDSLISIEGLLGSSFTDRLTGNAGDNTLDGGNGSDLLFGLDGTDRLLGGLGADELNGGGGSDRMNGGFDPDFIDGGEGADTVEYDFATRAVLVQLGFNGADGRADADSSALLGSPFEDILRGIENVVGSAFGDTIFGNEGANVLSGLDGNDYFGGDLGADTINGNNGQDTVDYNLSTAAVTIALDGRAGVGGFAAGDRLSNIETLGGSGFSDRLTGNSTVNRLVGFGGEDRLDGGGAADTMDGGAASDTYIVDTAGDIIIEAIGSGTADRVTARTSYTLGAGVEIELMTTDSSSATTAIDLTGNEFAQEIVGNAGANILKGGAGAADQMRGLGGSDTYRVFNSGDLIQESSAQGNDDRVIAAIDYALGSGVHVELFTTNGSTGLSGIDLTGNEVGQNIIGNAGANRIDGKGGLDTLRGFGGADRFGFSTALSASNVDTILDFNVAADTIELENSVFTALTATGVLATAAFRANVDGRAQDADDRIVHETDTGKLFYDADGTGVTAGVHFATLAAGLALSNVDFALV